jgi:peptidoglycan hydrolase CwlO-like protein
MEVIDEVDYIIIPFTKGNRSGKTTLDTIKAILEIMANDKTKFALLFNMYNDEEDIEKELKPLEKEVKEILGDRYKCSATLKFSKAVATMEREKKSIDELDLTNRIAYKAFKKRVREMNNKLKKCLFNIKD